MGEDAGGKRGAGAAGGSFIPLATIRPASTSGLDLAAVRERLAGSRGREYWRSLEELADTDEFRLYLEKEFPRQAPRDMEPLSRREFFRVMGASLALAGVGGCAFQPAERIVPYVSQPEQLVPGKPLFYATAFPRCGYALGVLGESHMGRPVKLEGNPQHPASLGATDAFTQASLLTLYDPDRSQAVRHNGILTSWEAFLAETVDLTTTLRQSRGTGLRILTETVTSPTLTAQLQRLLTRYPNARIHQHEPAGQEAVRQGARMAFGNELNPVYHFDRADRILSLDADFLVEEPGSVRYARDFSDRRRVRAGRTAMNRLYAVESTPTLTGANADHRLAIRPSQVEGVARAVAAGLGVSAAAGATPPPGVPETWIAAVVKDLREAGPAALVVAGAGQPPAVHALAHAINGSLGSLGQTVTLTAPVEAHFGGREGSLRSLVDDINAGSVQTLFILSANPVFTAPADLAFREAVEKVLLRVHLGLYDDETGAVCQWHIPESHYLEAWSDARAYDGTASIIQPLIRPLYTTHSAHELLAVLIGEGDRSGRDIVREHWIGARPEFAPRAGGAGGGGTTTGQAAPVGPGAPAPVGSPAFERFWHKALTDGVIPGTQAPAKQVAVRGDFATALGQAAPAPASGGGLEICFRPDPSIWDGRFANNGWLQELPKPMTQLTWDNAVLVSPTTAESRRLGNEQMVELSYGGRTLRAPIWIVPGQPDDVVTLHLGYGRTRAGRLGTGMGFNAYALRTADSPGFGVGVEMPRIGGIYNLVSAQHHFSMHGRNFVRSGTVTQLEENPTSPEFMHEHHPPAGALYPKGRDRWPSDRAEIDAHGGVGRAPDATQQETAGAGRPAEGVGPRWEGEGYNNQPIPAWGMVIDLTACIGCNACVLACQSENNIATVGKDQVAMNREMHWIRVDSYYRVGGQDAPDRPEKGYAGLQGNLETVFQPVPCMQCESAPCEPVCPVEATSHSAEGLNEQTYNRCVGTRYCQNNCPWKVRRFNYFQFSDQQTPTIQLMRNPDVTVRSRGVMEKCTYCVQRINEARIQAEKEDRAIRDGDILTACQQVCPTQAIIFGNLNDTSGNGGRGSRVRQLKQEPTNYTTLTELNTRPRTSYLARVRNPNPELASGEPAAATPGH